MVKVVVVVTVLVVVVVVIVVVVCFDIAVVVIVKVVMVVIVVMVVMVPAGRYLIISLRGPRATQRSVGRDFQNWDNSVYGEDGFRIYRWQRHTPNPGIHFGSSFSNRIIFHPIIGVFRFWHGSNLSL